MCLSESNPNIRIWQDPDPPSLYIVFSRTRVSPDLQIYSYLYFWLLKNIFNWGAVGFQKIIYCGVFLTGDHRKNHSTERFISYRKYILQITQPSRYRCTQLQYRFAGISEAPSITRDVLGRMGGKSHSPSNFLRCQPP